MVPIPVNACGGFPVIIEVSTLSTPNDIRIDACDLIDGGEFLALNAPINTWNDDFEKRFSSRCKILDDSELVSYVCQKTRFEAGDFLSFLASAIVCGKLLRATPIVDIFDHWPFGPITVGDLIDIGLTVADERNLNVISKDWVLIDESDFTLIPNIDQPLHNTYGLNAIRELKLRLEPWTRVEVEAEASIVPVQDPMDVSSDDEDKSFHVVEDVRTEMTMSSDAPRQRSGFFEGTSLTPADFGRGYPSGKANTLHIPGDDGTTFYILYEHPTLHADQLIGEENLLRHEGSLIVRIQCKTHKDALKMGMLIWIAQYKSGRKESPKTSERVLHCILFAMEKDGQTNVIEPVFETFDSLLQKPSIGNSWVAEYWEELYEAAQQKRRRTE